MAPYAPRILTRRATRRRQLFFRVLPVDADALDDCRCPKVRDPALLRALTPPFAGRDSGGQDDVQQQPASPVVAVARACRARFLWTLSPL